MNDELSEAFLLLSDCTHLKKKLQSMTINVLWLYSAGGDAESSVPGPAATERLCARLHPQPGLCGRRVKVQPVTDV